MISKGYVAVFESPLDKTAISEFVASWLERFEKVEQITSNGGTAACAVGISKTEEILWETNLQLRVSNGDDFAWVYITLNRRVIETSGLPVDDISLCLDVLLELPGITEIVEEHNDRRLDELEAQGLL